MSSSIANDRGSESPLSELSGTPSPPNSPTYNTSPDTIRVQAPAPTDPVTTSTPAKGKATARTSARKISSISKSASSRGRAETSSSTKKVASGSKSGSGHGRTVSNSSTIKVATTKREQLSSPAANDTPSDTTSSEDDNDRDTFFPGIQVPSSSAKSNTGSAKIANSSSPAPASPSPAYPLSKLTTGEVAPGHRLIKTPVAAIDAHGGRAASNRTPAQLSVTADSKAQKSPKPSVDDEAFSKIGKAPEIAVKKVDAKKHGRDGFEDDDVTVGGDKDMAKNGDLPKQKRSRVASKKAREAAQSDEDFVETSKSSSAKKSKNGKVATSPKTSIKFTSGGIAAAAAAKAKENDYSTPRKGPGRPRKYPKPEEKEDATLRVAESVKSAPKPAGRSGKRNLNLFIDMNDSVLGLANKDKVNPSVELNDSPSPPAKTARTSKAVTPPKANINASRKSKRSPKCSPKALEALAASGPAADIPDEPASGFQSNGTWKEPDVVTNEQHWRAKKELWGAQDRAKKSPQKQPNKSRKFTVAQWKVRYGATLPEPNYHLAEDDEENLSIDMNLSRGKSDEEEMKAMAEFYKAEMSVEHRHPICSSGSYKWHSQDWHHEYAPESYARTIIPEPAWKTRKYEAELVGKLDNYSPPFQRFWEAQVEALNVEVQALNVQGECKGRTLEMDAMEVDIVEGEKGRFSGTELKSFWEAEAEALNVPWKGKGSGVDTAEGEKGGISPTERKHWFKKTEPEISYSEKGCPKKSRCVDKEKIEKFDQEIDQEIEI